MITVGRNSSGENASASAITGPRETFVTFRKQRIAGIFVNAESRTFVKVPSYLTVLANRTIGDIADVNTLRRRVGMVFQQSNLMPWRTVLDNLALPLELAGVDRVARHNQAAQTLDRIGLTGFERAFPAELSGGMAQRVIANSLSRN